MQRLRDISPSFPELEGWNLEVCFGYAGRRYAYVKVAKFHSKRYANVIVNRRLKNLSVEAVSALITHELAHVVLRERGTLDSEEAASREAIRRGSKGYFRKLFADICKNGYCQARRRRSAFPFVAQNARYRFHLVVAGLGCEEFCPCYSNEV